MKSFKEYLAEGVKKALFAMGHTPDSIKKIPHHPIKESVSKSEEDNVIDSHHNKSTGDRFELHGHGDYHAIVKTHQSGEHLKNKYGGYPPLTTGKPSYVKRKWDKLKKEQKKTVLGDRGMHVVKENEKVSFKEYLSDASLLKEEAELIRLAEAIEVTSDHFENAKKHPVGTKAHHHFMAAGHADMEEHYAGDRDYHQATKHGRLANWHDIRASKAKS